MDEAAYQAYRSAVVSPALRSIWKEVYGDRFWTDSDPPWTMATVDDVDFITDSLRPQRTSLLVNLGCGTGGFERHAARECGARVHGIDANANAVRLAQELCGRLGFSDSLSFQVGGIGAMPFLDAMFDGAASLDVLLFAPDKDKALRDVARVLKPGARFAGTTWELRKRSEALNTPAFADYPGAFTAAGFVVEAYAETDSWRSLLEGVLAGILAREGEVASEVHPEAVKRLRHWAQTRPPEVNDSRRVRFCVRRPG